MNASENDFRGLVEEHSAMVFSIALRMVGDRGAAEEISQDVFLALHSSLSGLQSSDHVLFWLRRVAVHRSTDHLRKRRLRPEAGAEEWREEHSPTACASERRLGEIDSRLESMVQSLPAPLRSAVVLRYQEDLAPAEIAALLHLPVSTVKSALRRALEMLRRKAGAALKEYQRG